MQTTEHRQANATVQTRLHAVFSALAANGVAYWFDLRGNTGVREDRYNDYLAAAERAGTDRWVGEHVGNRDTGGAHYGQDGRLYGRDCFDRTWLIRELWFSFNHEHPDLAELLVSLFAEHGFDADWSGDASDCVTVDVTR